MKYNSRRIDESKKLSGINTTYDLSRYGSYAHGHDKMGENISGIFALDLNSKEDKKNIEIAKKNFVPIYFIGFAEIVVFWKKSIEKIKAYKYLYSIRHHDSMGHIQMLSWYVSNKKIKPSNMSIKVYFKNTEPGGSDWDDDHEIESKRYDLKKEVDEAIDDLIEYIKYAIEEPTLPDSSKLSNISPLFSDYIDKQIEKSPNMYTKYKLLLTKKLKNKWKHLGGEFGFLDDGYQMKYIEEYNGRLFEGSKALPESEHVKRILDFLNHYYDLFARSDDEWISNKILQFKKTAKKYKLISQLFVIIINSEFYRDKSFYKLRFPENKATKEDVLFYYQEYNKKSKIDAKELYNKNKEDPEFRKKIYKKHRDWEKKKRKEDPKWAKEKDKKEWIRQKNKRKEDPEYVIRTNKTRSEWAKQKRKNDPEWAKALDKKSSIIQKEKREEDSEYREKINKSALKSYHKKKKKK